MSERTWWQVFRYPIAIAVATTIGLGLALVGDHVGWRVLTWAALAAPVVVVGRAMRA